MPVEFYIKPNYHSKVYRVTEGLSHRDPNWKYSWKSTQILKKERNNILDKRVIKYLLATVLHSKLNTYTKKNLKTKILCNTNKNNTK